MFPKFRVHLKNQGFLIFTCGPKAGEVWSDNGGRNLFHASLSTEEYRKLLDINGFVVINHFVEVEDCGGSSFWIAQLKK